MPEKLWRAAGYLDDWLRRDGDPELHYVHDVSAATMSCGAMWTGRAWYRVPVGSKRAKCFRCLVKEAACA